MVRTKAGLAALLLLIGCSAPSAGGGGDGNGDGGTAGTDPDPPAGRGGKNFGGTGGTIGGDTGGTVTEPEPESPGTEVDVSIPSDADLDGLERELESVDGLDVEGLLGRYPAGPFVADVGYDPLQAVRLDELQSSALELDESALAILAERGFVIDGKREFSSFVNGYTAIYGEHLPLYVSADSILQAVHRSYDSILESIETEALI